MNNIYLNILYGLLLGDSLIINNNKEMKFKIIIQGKHLAYMKDIHNKIKNFGYCTNNFKDVKIITKLGKKGKLYKLMLLDTYNNKDYLELYNKWYLDKLNKNIPKDMIIFFNEQSLAY
jgi:hypothetical protein